MRITKLDDLIERSASVKGRWEITPNHEVQYRSQGKEEEFKFKGSIIAAEPDALIVSITEKQSDQKIVTSLGKLQGSWKLDSKNRIVFEVEKEKGKKDSLTFKGGWRINDSNELVYTYQQTDLKRKRRITRELAFHGFWDISDQHRLTYWLGGDSDSAFRFRGAFQTRSILAKQGALRYQAGIEINGRHKIQTIALFGKWKMSHNLELSFEVEYADGVRKAITFGGEYALSDDSRITVNLKTEQGEPLGIELVLTKDIFGKDGQAFMRLERFLEESGVEAGMRFRW